MYLTKFNILIFMFLPLVASLSILFISRTKIYLIKKLSLVFSFIILIYSILIFFSILKLNFNLIIEPFQFGSNFLNINYILGWDIFSVIFIILTAALIPICFLVNWTSVKYLTKEYMIVLFIIEWLLFNIFSVRDILIFYIFFESLLIPMFLLIAIWGSRRRKIHAAYQFFLYTFFGSIFLLFVCFVLYCNFGTTNLLTFYTSNIQISYSISNDFIFNNKILWLFVFLGFAIKIPMVPFHIWLPEAHVEAPTSGSILLAGILLKLGTYGMVKILMPLFPYETLYFTPLVFTLALLGVIYSACATIRQVDLKKIIAYSSVVHMNFAMLGLFSLNIQGIVGCLFSMVSHGIVASGLFFLVGVLYDRYGTRLIKYYGGLVLTMPIYCVFLFLFIFANIGLPGTSSFVGEILTLIGIVNAKNYFAALFSSFSMVLGAIFSLWLFNRIVFRTEVLNNLNYYLPITFKEISILTILAIFVISLGIYPKPLLDSFSLYYIDFFKYS